jgi:hypothetical protein
LKVLLDNQVFFGLNKCLDIENDRLMKIEAGWALSNITAGSESDLEAFLRTDLLDKIISLIDKEENEVSFFSLEGGIVY